MTGSQGTRPMYRCFNGECERNTTVTAANLEEHLRWLLHDVAIDVSGELEALEDGAVPGRLLPADNEPVLAAESALRSAELARDEFAAAELDVSPQAWAARARALDEAVEAAQLAYEGAVAEAEPIRQPPLSAEIRKAPAPELPALLRRMHGNNATLVVQPGKGKLEERVRLIGSEPVTLEAV